MRTLRAMMLTAALMALWVGTQATGAHTGAGGRAQGNVTAERAGSGPYSLSFKASGTPNQGHG